MARYPWGGERVGMKLLPQLSITELDTNQDPIKNTLCEQGCFPPPCPLVTLWFSLACCVVLLEKASESVLG